MNTSVFTFRNWAYNHDEFTISEIINNWRYKLCGMSAFSLYIEIEGIENAYLKLSKRNVTFGRLGSVIPMSIMSKIVGFFKDEPTMNSRFIKSSFSVYSDANNRIGSFLKPMVNSTKYNLIDLETDGFKYVYLKLRELQPLGE